MACKSRILLTTGEAQLTQFALWAIEVCKRGNSLIFMLTISGFGQNTADKSYLQLGENTALVFFNVPPIKVIVLTPVVVFVCSKIWCFIC